MASSILKTKLYAPPIREDLVSRPRLIERLNARPERKLTLISAPAGFGKNHARHRVAAQPGQLTEIRQADLCFTTDEATTYLNQAMRLGLDTANIAALKAHTEGWISGIVRLSEDQGSTTVS